MDEDIRWMQRLTHFRKALAQLGEGVELAWNVLKDFLESRGTVRLYGSKDTSREAFKRGLIENGEAWMGMIKSRNLSSHTYSESTAKQIVARIIQEYHPEFIRLLRTMERVREEDSA